MLISKSLDTGKIIKKKEFENRFNEDRYFWLLIPILILIYYIYSTYSNGFYGDDEIGYLLSIKHSLDNLGYLVGMSNKPGYRLIFFLPSLVGSTILIFFHILISSLTVYCVFLLCKQLRIKYSALIATLFAFQPFIVQFSFRTWPEILTSFLIVNSFLFFSKGKFIISALISSYLFTVRQEYGVAVCFIMSIFYLYKVINEIIIFRKSSENEFNISKFKYSIILYIIPLLLLAVFPFILIIAGFIYSGDLFYTLHDMKKYAIEKAESFRDFWHYFRMYIFVVGPAVLSLIIIGYIFYFKDFKNKYSHSTILKMIIICFTVVFLMFVFMGWDKINIGGGTGALRFLIPLSPLASVIAGIGLECLLDKRNKIIILAILSIIALIVLLFLSNDYNRTVLTDSKEYYKFISIIIIFVAVFIYCFFKVSSKVIIFSILFIGISYSLLKEKPITIKEDYDKNILQEIFQRLKNDNYLGRKIYSNQIYTAYLLNKQTGEDLQNINFQKSSLESADIGTIFIYDYHYSFRPGYGGDTRLRDFVQNPQFKLLYAYRFPDRIVSFAVFEKIRSNSSINSDSNVIYK